MKKNDQKNFARRLSLRGTSAGIATVFALMMLFMLVGGGFGLWRFDLEEIGDLKFKFWIWASLSWVASHYIGAYIAAFAANSPAKEDGLLHGFLVWASSMVITAGALGVLSGAFFGGFLAPVESEAMCWSVFGASVFALAASLRGGRKGALCEAGSSPATESLSDNLRRPMDPVYAP